MTIPADKDCRNWPTQPDAPLKGRNDGGSALNLRPSGSIIVSGLVQEGQTLTASNTITDADGLGVFTTSWEQSGVPIPGETGSALLLTSSHVGDSVRQVVTYADGSGQPEIVRSAYTSDITAPSASPAALLDMFTGSNNVWYTSAGTQNNAVTPSWDLSPIVTDPLLTFTGPKFTVGVGSPVINAGVIPPNTLLRDIYGMVRTGAIDIGAVERQ